MIIVPPSGMRYDLARKLVEDDAFAHMWLVHGVTGECPDGCDAHGNPHKVKLYENITVYHTKSDIAAYERGYKDCMSDKRALFQRTVGRGIQPTIDDDMADNWSEEQREAYCDGYERAGRHIP